MSQLPKLSVVALGGGHGLTASIAAAKLLGADVTALVNVADDGGSSGRLRSQYGIVPPGDIRMCLRAMLPSDSKFASLLDYRFESGDLDGHALGNLLLIAASMLYQDNAKATALVGELFGTVGSVYPVSNEALVLYAQLEDGSTVTGQVDIHNSSQIAKIWVEPRHPKVATQALDAIAKADLILLGPGSLFTSVLAAVAPHEIRCALEESKATKVFVANLREQKSESVGLTVAQALDLVEFHGVYPQYVVADDSNIAAGSFKGWMGKVYLEPLTSSNPYLHDPHLLSVVLGKIVEVT